MDITLFDSIILLFFVAVFVASLFRYLKLPSILGYIVVGALVGPHALGWVSDRHDIRGIAEFGVVFLLFTIGLEFSLPKLMTMKSIVFGFGGLQVLLTTIIATFVGVWLIGMSMPTSLIIGSIVAMSSTAIVMKQLSEQLELNSRHGSNAVGMLLMQDLAVIPFLILIPSLSHLSHETIAADLLWTLLKSAAAILLIFSVGRWILRPLFHRITTVHSTELFTLTILLVTLSAAWLTNRLDLSLALGAFIAGIMLGETEFRHQINVEIRPFKDVLLGLFFITIGMQFNLQILPQTWAWVLLMIFALLIFKMLLVLAIGILFKNDLTTSLRSGLVVAQGGEFGFVLLIVALNHQLVPVDYGQVILSALLFSMALSPLIIRHNGKIAYWLLPKFMRRDHTEARKQVLSIAGDIQEHVIICGYGHIGQHVAALLQQEHIVFVALDLDVAKVKEAQLSGDSVSYGDATRQDILLAAGIRDAKIIILCIKSHIVTQRILELIRRINSNIAVLVRAEDDRESEILQALGATEVIPGALETTLLLATHALLLMGVPTDNVSKVTDSYRKERYVMLQKVYPENEVVEDQDFELSQKSLHNVTIPTEASSIGKSLASFELHKIGVEIIAMRRAGRHYSDPDSNTELLENDILILCGSEEDVINAQKQILNETDRAAE